MLNTSSHYVAALRAEASRSEVALIRDIRRKYIEYKANPSAHIDFNSGRPAFNEWGDEISGGMTFTCKSMEDVTGLSRLGNGAYSVVYSINERLALKIVRREDSGYARFVELVKQYPNNPYFPKILYSGEWAGSTVYVLERLTESPEDDCWSRNENFRDAMYAFRRNSNSNNEYFKTSFVCPQMEEAARLLDENNLLDDLHAGNVMFRGNTPVVTDPCTY